MNVVIKPVSLNVAIKNPIIRDYSQIDTYDGEYTITPSAEEQVLQTYDKRMAENLVINPIPSNYGLITWNGAILTVS